MTVPPETIRVLALMEASSVGGPPKNLIEFAKRAKELREGLPRVELAIATFQRGAGPPNAFVTAARGAGIEVFVLSEKRRFDSAPFAQLRSAVAAFKPDVIQSHNVKSHFFVRRLGLYRQFPWIAFNHGYTNTDWKDQAYNQFDRWSLRAACRVVTVCRAFAPIFEALGVAPDHIRIQHNSVRPFVAAPADVVERVKTELALDHRPVILSIGRLSYEKGHADLLQAISIGVAKGTLRDVRVVLVGDGPEMESLKSAAIRLGIQDQVQFAGQRSDVRPYYSLATLLALPSHSEGSPNVVLESMAAGVPIVATSVGGVPEILTGEATGLLVPVRDPAAMAAGIERLLADPALRAHLAEAARDHVAAHYTPEAHCRSLISLYLEAISAFDRERPVSASAR